MIDLAVFMVIVYFTVPAPGNYILIGALVIGSAIEESSKRGRE